jgi:hypothetical protein
MLNNTGSYQKISIQLLFLISALCIVSACERLQSGQQSDVLATVNGSVLTLENAMESIPDFYLEQDTVLALIQYRDQWIENQIAADHALEIGIDKTDSFRRELMQLENDLLTSRLRETILSENRDELLVSDEEAQQYYQNNRDQFLINERFVRFRHITTRSRSDAENANRDLMNGIDWNDVVENYSIDPDYQKEFSEQYWPESMVLADYPQLREFLSIIGITERSPITYENGNFHLIQLTDEITEGEYPDLNWLIPQIKEWLAVEKSRRLVNGYLRNLYLQAESNNEIESADVEQLEQIIKQHQFREQ